LGDRGVPFHTRYRGPRFSMGNDWSKFSKLRKVKFKFEEPKGNIQLTILGTNRKSLFGTLAAKTLSNAASSSNSGLGFDPLGSVQLGDTAGTASNFSSKNTQCNIKLKDRVRDVQVQVETRGLENEYKMHGYYIEGFLLSTKDPASERL
jgi:hypothetical protein